MDETPEALRDAGYVLVGLGVIWFQRAQVLRRELSRDLPGVPDLRAPLAGAVRSGARLVRSVLDGSAAAPRRP
ncbi:MAG TPA: hypothetical protein VHM89_01160 [Acidimicrobiales bacterium]|nr:hypothetical protein [Acidimicrobiales bacterium]